MQRLIKFIYSFLKQFYNIICIFKIKKAEYPWFMVQVYKTFCFGLPLKYRPKQFKQISLIYYKSCWWLILAFLQHKKNENLQPLPCEGIRPSFLTGLWVKMSNLNLQVSSSRPSAFPIGHFQNELPWMIFTSSGSFSSHCKKKKKKLKHSNKMKCR